MVALKLSLIITGLILTVCQGPFLLAAEVVVPLPADVIKVSEENRGSGIFKATIETYQSNLAQNKIEAFYKKEMAQAGWAENIKGLFVKNGYMAVVTVIPSKDLNGMIQFYITTSKLPDQNEFLAQRKAKPDKLNFMPIYPGCVQNFLWDTSKGISASYGTEDNIKDVIFFYKSGMLSYGWYLYSEVPLKEEAVNQPGYNNSNKPVTGSSASLRFRKKSGESCFIRIISISGIDTLLPGEKIVDKNNVYLPSKTSILIVYNEKKRINQ
jgi:antitoxin component YwqK of YwqJK toxin-antitoxin module